MIRLEQDGTLWLVTLNRPDKANALTREMLSDLADIAEDAAGKAQALILTGAGKVFSAGMDLAAAKAGLATDPVWERLSGALVRAPYLSIAALNGTLAGGAFGMALACDLRLCVPSAKFFYPVMKLGFLPQPSDPARMTALIGPARAKMIFMAGQKIEAEQALAWGLVNQVAPGETLLDSARALAADTLGAAPAHSAAIKALFP
ncbi:MAG TPA: enoyl-CoA hydratase/isomerase family protein [Aliiroseovarius sp.]|nr:enoyl-CoA hydratase/isomerase family protein [Aliiroseovarius sp.]